MKQTSLYDSFIKGQQNSQSQNQAAKAQAGQPQPLLDKNEIKEKNKKALGSDGEKSQVTNKIPDIQIGYEQNLGEKPNAAKKTKSNNKKSEKQVQKQASDMQIENQKEGDQGKQQYKADAIKRQDEFENEKDFLQQFSDATPIWAQKQHCKDKGMRKVNDPHYDPTTLYVPSQAWPKFSAPMKQFWSIKSENFDKIVCFKLGKFYEMFYDDAAIGNRYLQLKYMGTKMHTGFPQKCLDRYANELLELGFKLVIVEQMETPAQMTSRVAEDKKKGIKSDRTLNRQVTQVLTKGTYSKQESDTVYLPNYLLSLRSLGECFAFSLLEIGTNEITMDTVDSIDKLKTILYQTRPSQIVYDPDNLNFDLAKMMQQTFLNIQMSKVANKNNLWHPLNAVIEIERLDKEGKMKRGKIFELIDKLSEVNKNLLYATLSGMFEYLKRVLRFQYVMSSVRFTFYHKEQHSKSMILDSQALQHLQIFQTSDGVEGSLFKTIDRTKTKFGKRLLRKWLMSPLMNEHHINQRLNAIEDIQSLGIEKQRITQKLKKLPDMDKKLNKLYHYAVKSTNASKAVYFADISTLRLKQFKQIMQNMEQCCELIEIFSQSNKKFKSTRLKQLTTIGNTVKINDDDVYEEDEEYQSSFEGLLPDVLANLQGFKTYIKWQDNVPQPQKGLVPHFDELKDEQEKIKQELQKFIEEMRYQMNEPNLKFVHIKQRYEIEVPEKSDKKKPKNFQFCSKKAGFSRYLCPTVKAIVKRLEKNEADTKEQMALFIGFFFEEFKKKQKIWQRFVEIIAEIDCLVSLSEYSFSNEKVRPIFTSETFSIKGAKHPCLTMIDFIPNDIIMKEKIMLLTGPNMGGKSTILRTVCLLAVLAQVGCYVPCLQYNCQIIDRVFTRIGASDKLELGKSTFFIEMQETKSVLEHATSKSLVIMDELGRGTSTFDGLSIAFAVLRNIIEDLKCYCLFATHYHILIDEFRLRPEVSLMKMDSILKEEQIIFLYKLVKGNVERSFGLSIASRVGMDKSIVELAEKEAEKMNSYMEGRRRSVLENVMEWLK